MLIIMFFGRKEEVSSVSQNTEVSSVSQKTCKTQVSSAHLGFTSKRKTLHVQNSHPVLDNDVILRLT